MFFTTQLTLFPVTLVCYGAVIEENCPYQPTSYTCELLWCCFFFFHSVSIEQTCGASVPAGSPLGTPEPLVLLTPPRCLTANRTQHGVLLTWLPPANHSSPIDRYIMEFRLGERWEVLDDLIPSTETELIARDLVQVSGGQMIPCEFAENVHEDDAMLFQPYFRKQPRLVKHSRSCLFFEW